MERERDQALDQALLTLSVKVGGLERAVERYIATTQAQSVGVPQCDLCGESIGVHGWMRHPFSSAAPRALCSACMPSYMNRLAFLPG
jgi:hypothetical protein